MEVTNHSIRRIYETQVEHGKREIVLNLLSFEELLKQDESTERLEIENNKFNRLMGHFAGELSNLADVQPEVESELRRLAKEMMLS